MTMSCSLAAALAFDARGGVDDTEVNFAIVARNGILRASCGVRFAISLHRQPAAIPARRTVEDVVVKKPVQRKRRHRWWALHFDDVWRDHITTFPIHTIRVVSNGRATPGARRRTRARRATPRGCVIVKGTRGALALWYRRHDR